MTWCPNMSGTFFRSAQCYHIWLGFPTCQGPSFGVRSVTIYDLVSQHVRDLPSECAVLPYMTWFPDMSGTFLGSEQCHHIWLGFRICQKLPWEHKISPIMRLVSRHTPWDPPSECQEAFMWLYFQICQTASRGQSHYGSDSITRKRAFLGVTPYEAWVPGYAK